MMCLLQDRGGNTASENNWHARSSAVFILIMFFLSVNHLSRSGSAGTIDKVDARPYDGTTAVLVAVEKSASMHFCVRSDHVLVPHAPRLPILPWRQSNPAEDLSRVFYFHSALGNSSEYFNPVISFIAQSGSELARKFQKTMVFPENVKAVTLMRQACDG